MNVPYCVSLRGTLDDWAIRQKALKKRIYLTLFARRMLEQAAFVHCTARAEAEQSHRHFPRGQVRVIPNLINLECFHTEIGNTGTDNLRFAKGERLLLFLSRVYPGKGLELIIDSLPKILRSAPDVRLLIAGEGNVEYIKRLQARARALNCAEQVKFLGFVTGEVKAAVYRNASALVLASEHENFGNVLFEAAAAGTPLIISKEVATWRELQTGVGAIVVHRTADAIQDAFLKILARDKRESERLAANSRAWIGEYLDPRRLLPLYESAYRLQN
jgi:glycosyltransferase involved in cell wall biosynthesis